MGFMDCSADKGKAMKKARAYHNALALQLCYCTGFHLLIIASATRIPSTAAEVMPPA
jgi:xanthine dehydrogenase iron-sulfur cluster and FAD-binding subunit A